MANERCSCPNFRPYFDVIPDGMGGSIGVVSAADESYELGGVYGLR